MTLQPTIPATELQRLAAVRRYAILDTPPDGAFDRVTALAARRFSVPISIISIVDHDRIWFKSHYGVEIKQIGREPGLCASAILTDQPYLLPDAKLDVRSLAHPLVAGAFGLRFYAAVPLRTHDAHNLGTLCVIDKEPRPIDVQQIEDLKDLASIVMDQIELHLSARLAVEQAQMMGREIDHRVMNSLQFVTSMLRMQARSSSIPDVSSHLQIAAGRVSAVASVHRHFYVDEPSEFVECLTFLRRVCEELASILAANIRVGGTTAMVKTTQLQPIGLIVNELVTNAAKHGSGQIDVTFNSDKEGNFVLCVRDEGPGLPQGFRLGTSSSSLGMKLVSVLVRQLQGDLVPGLNSSGPGACFTIVFPTTAANLPDL